MGTMSEWRMSRTYDLWSLVYDGTFGALVRNRQLLALEQLELRSGDHLLDIGVGTGMMLEHYPSEVHVVGIDLSAGMLAKAHAKQHSMGLRHCSLVRTDAMLPPFADASFDHVVITHTISVVSDPSRLLRWAARLLRPGGRIVVLNHFRSTDRIIGWIEGLISPLCVKLGLWRSDLSLEDVLARVELDVEYLCKLRQCDLWKIVVLSLRRPGAPTVRAVDPCPEHPPPLPDAPLAVDRQV